MNDAVETRLPKDAGVVRKSEKMGAVKLIEGSFVESMPAKEAGGIVPEQS